MIEQFNLVLRALFASNSNMSQTLKKAKYLK